MVYRGCLVLLHGLQKKELERFIAQAKEMKELKERWNLLDFKYQLLLDMVQTKRTYQIFALSDSFEMKESLHEHVPE